MKKSTIRFAFLSILAVAPSLPAAAEVRQVEIDVAGYLCGL